MRILPSLVSDFPAWFPLAAAQRFGSAFDVEGRLPRAIDDVAAVADRDVLLLDTAADGIRAEQMRALGGRVTTTDAGVTPTPDSADVVIAFWSALDRPGTTAEASARRALRQGGRLVAIHEYGRDDLTRFAVRSAEAGRDEHDRREAPFLAAGWRIRVLHCWWAFDDVETARRFVEATPGGAAAAANVSKHRVAHNVALLYRTVEQAG